MAAGGLAVFFQTVVTTPMELLKIQLQLEAQNQAGRKTPTLQLIQQVFKTQGK